MGGDEGEDEAGVVGRIDEEVGGVHGEANSGGDAAISWHVFEVEKKGRSAEEIDASSSSRWKISLFGRLRGGKTSFWEGWVPEPFS